MTDIHKRPKRAKEKLFEAYITLLQLKDSQSITIQQLTRTARVNRVTFYKHFKNSNNFHEQFLQHYIENLYQYMKPLNYKPYEKGFEYTALVDLLEYILAHKNHYHLLFTSENIPDFNKSLLSYFRQKITKHTEELAKFHFPGIDVHQEIVSWYGVSALFGTIIMWAHSNFKYSPVQLAQSIMHLTPSEQ